MSPNKTYGLGSVSVGFSVVTNIPLGCGILTLAKAEAGTDMWEFCSLSSFAVNLAVL